MSYLYRYPTQKYSSILSIPSFINTIIVSIKSFVKIINNLVDVRGAEKGNDTQAPAVTGKHSNKPLNQRCKICSRSQIVCQMSTSYCLRSMLCFLKSIRKCPAVQPMFSPRCYYLDMTLFYLK